MTRLSLRAHHKFDNILPEAHIPPKLLMLAQLSNQILVLVPDLRGDVEQIVQNTLVAVHFDHNSEDVLDYGG